MGVPGSYGQEGYEERRGRIGNLNMLGKKIQEIATARVWGEGFQKEDYGGC